MITARIQTLTRKELKRSSFKCWCQASWQYSIDFPSHFPQDADVMSFLNSAFELLLRVWAASRDLKMVGLITRVQLKTSLPRLIPTILDFYGCRYGNSEVSPKFGISKEATNKAKKSVLYVGGFLVIMYFVSAKKRGHFLSINSTLPPSSFTYQVSHFSNNIVLSMSQRVLHLLFSAVCHHAPCLTSHFDQFL
ncbi:uncharacterized protein LOC108338284 isoform X4 [Vigna angularis]|uniref:uncharacterized protein LOC108338284 isoform X4 n=1 Tax=Phaseolus angularis TaxID=3914 RepID=UPI0022B42AF6|nr:uncharacterized protein LOC108338284 isoform X4 [Vigna angularis]